ncbi:MAG: sporulation initiation factor Spo0A C-terminal domain-containing protein [Lachnospiraceae bacterium]|nr:sporulation initiation factor Spo0A C-terminal domain-containing protein [Lachnospiraceae bacterium]
MLLYFHNRTKYLNIQWQLGKIARGENDIRMNHQMEKYVTKIMLELGVPAHLKGYHYLRKAILLSLEDMEVVSSVTKLLYPEIAKCFQTTDQKVERAIRNAIEVSWTRGNMRTVEDLFGYSQRTGKNRPTNSEYIARIADKIHLDFDINIA